MVIQSTAMYNNIDKGNYRELSKLVQQVFFYNQDAYGKQQFDENGKVIYKTIYSRIDANIIQHSIENKKALMAYQQKINKLKWLCLDFDIKTSVLDSGYDFFEDEIHRPLLIKEVNKAINYLNENKINYLLEFSGTRGFHIWIILNREVSKQLGSKILDSLVEKFRFDYLNDKSTSIVLDMYPKNANPKGNKIGLGVKIPVSFHLKSGRYSMLLSSLDDVKIVTELNTKIISEQENILRNYKVNDITNLIKVLGISISVEEKKYDRMIGTIDKSESLTNIINMLSKCDVYKHLFSKSIADLNEFDRAIIVGTFIRLRNDSDLFYGKKLLLEFFAEDAEKFNETITREKLELMQNFYPPSIEYLHKKYDMECSHCNGMNNILELIEGITIQEDLNSVEMLLNWIIRAEKKYLTQNDEVPLNHVYDELNEVSIENLKMKIEGISKGEYPTISANIFIRKEEEKERVLYGLSATDRVLTSYIMYEINKILYGEYSTTSSYSYKLNYDFRNNDIFINWNRMWLMYVKEIEDKIFNEAYNDYYILKLDIRGFYDSINRIFLREILFNKPSAMIELILKNLSPKEKRKYVYMCEYLIDAASKISSTGVPQGPAFARYLAEIYLAPLDQIISSNLIEGFEHYYRYVDDMVIIVESKEKAEVLLGDIKNYLNTRDLNLNDKVKQGYVKEMKYEIINQDLQKYFIDSIDESTAPVKVINKAIELLNDMLNDPYNSLNKKNLPFFLTHLIDADYLQSKVGEIVPNVVNSEIGRGSLFKHFYKNIIFKYVEDISLDFYKSLKGLSRANFINEMAKNVESISETAVAEIIQFYLNEELYPYEKVELLRILLKTGYKFELNLSYEDLEIILFLVKYTNDIIWSDDLLKQVTRHLQGKTDKREVINNLEDLLNSSRRIEDTSNIVQTIYISLSEHFDDIYSEDLLQKIFNLISYVSIFLEEIQVKDIWGKFYKSVNLDSQNLNTREWYKFKSIINKDEINDATVIVILTRVFKKEGIIQSIGTSKTEEEYALYLFLFLFKSEEYNERTLMVEKVKAIVEENNIEFIRWCLDENVRYFPSDEFAIKNIQFNNRIVMINNQKLLVRGLPEIFVDYEEHEIKNDLWYNDSEYNYIEIDVNEQLLNIEDKLISMHLFEALDFLISAEEMSEYNGRYINVFEKGTFIAADKKLQMSYSKNDKYIVLNDSDPVLNSKTHFINALIKVFKKIKTQTVEYNLNYNVESEKFFDEFVPKSLDKSLEIWEYLKILNKNLKRYIESLGDKIYVVELAKIESIKEYVNQVSRLKSSEESKREAQFGKFSKVLRILNMYHSLNPNSEFEKHLLYSHQELDTSNLQVLISGIIVSITKNIEHEDLSFLCDFFTQELNQIEENHTNIQDFELVNVQRHPFNKNKIKINGTDYEIEAIDIYEYGAESVTRELSIKDIMNLETNYIYFNKQLMVVLPNVIAKSIEIIRNKVNTFDKIHFVQNAYISNIDGYNQCINVIMDQNEVSKVEAEMRLYDFLKDKEERFYEPIIKVISAYKIMDKAEIDYLVEIIKLKVDLNNEKDCILPLKSDSDDNGLHQILYVKYKEIFDRNTLYKKRLINDFVKLNTAQNLNEIIIVTDIGVSGKQFTDTFKKYCEVKKGNNLKSEYHKIKNGEIFKGNLLNASKILILTCVYTDKFKSSIQGYFDKIGYRGALEFLGTEIKYKDYLFSTLIDKKINRDLFTEFINKYFADKELKVNGNSYLDFISQIEDVNTKNMLICRYKSMPKYHHVIFTKNNAIFKYRKDK
ncbi:reverse transcriptase domain-containing protein [Viridibacillus arvi]|uniref:reverse transcriptase domain-containing protein n=1 Tax=Viridibacillus arvi TaxID=263475 RepID=UPI0036E83464